MNIQHFFEDRTSTLTYVVHDPETRRGVVIDPVLDFDLNSGKTGTESCQRVAAYVDENGLAVEYVISTHAHADHLSGEAFFKDTYGSRTVIGENITRVQEVFKALFNLGGSVPADGSQFDLLMPEGKTLPVGSLTVEAIHTPGHTPACMTWKIGDALFVGDTIFMPDFGTARCDFPGGSAGTLYDSIQRLYGFPDPTRIFVCHDYRPGGREMRYQTTVGEQKRANVQLSAETSKEEFVRFRNERDSGLAVPNLILPSLQVNIRAGRLPAPESNGTAYLKLPLNRL
jgi:glyoxylase-like metal-dependent hydrolase (beta-lactamase superfamily II)